MSIGSNIRKYREKAALSQTDLAKKIGVAQPMINQIEREVKNPSILLGKDIADAVGCSLDDLVK